jgi:hypothetical protein
MMAWASGLEYAPRDEPRLLRIQNREYESRRAESQRGHGRVSQARGSPARLPAAAVDRLEVKRAKKSRLTPSPAAVSVLCCKAMAKRKFEDFGQTQNCQKCSDSWPKK